MRSIARISKALAEAVVVSGDARGFALKFKPGSIDDTNKASLGLCKDWNGNYLVMPHNFTVGSES